MLDEIEKQLERGNVKKALQIIIGYATAQTDPIWQQVKIVGQQYLSQLAMVNKEKSLGIIANDYYSAQNNLINFNTIKLINIIKNKDFDKLPSVSADQADGRIKRINEANFLDKAFKGLLLFLLGVSIVLLIRTMFNTELELDAQKMQASISLIGSFGSFFGYFKWRQTELK